jgi:acyl-CoA synthetase (AMP-forming)/AMP-acid ligase II
VTSPARLLDFVTATARSEPRREVIAAGAERLGYAELARSVETAAAVLTQAGLQPGARVAFFGGPGAGFLVSLLAVHAARGVWMGLNPRYTAPELAHVLSDARPCLVYVETGWDATALFAALESLDPPPAIQRLATVGDLAAPVQPLPRLGIPASEDVALLVYTSGTTGRPKGACLTHAAVVEAARLYVERYRHPDVRSVLNLPINHVGALIDLTASCLAMGGGLVASPRFDPAGLPDLLREEWISILGQVPAMHLAIDAASPYDPAALPHLKHLVWSGAAMPRSWIEARLASGPELSTCYGQTECTGSVTFTRPGASVDELADSVGRPPRPGLVRIAHAADTAGVGEVQVRGPLVMAGYFQRPDATAEAITEDGWLRTGDLGRFGEDGTLTLVGRSREMYKSGGYNVYPREVESALEAHPSVAAAAVLSMPDPHWQEVGWAFVITRQPVSPEDLNTFARERLANYKRPKRFVIRDALPLLPIGKIDKQALKAAATRGDFD